MWRLALILITTALAASAAQAELTSPETRVRMIPLAPPLDADVAEYSGMTCCGDRLILVPQYPKRYLRAKVPA